MPWEVILLDEVEQWFLDLAKGDADQVVAVTAAIDMLAASGPTLGRPIVDRVKGFGTAQHEGATTIGDEHPHLVRL